MMYQVLITNESEANYKLLEALKELGKVQTSTGVLVQTGDAHLVNVLGTLDGAVTLAGEETVTPARKMKVKTDRPKCMKCNLGNAGRDGLCTTCRNAIKYEETRERQKRKINEIAEKVRRDHEQAANIAV